MSVDTPTDPSAFETFGLAKNHLERRRHPAAIVGRKVVQTVTPKQVAKAIGVSESSLKRWCDQGLVPMVRTPGGHRRLPLRGVLDFLKKSGRQLTDPTVLGLPSNVGQGERTVDRAREQVRDGLLSGDEDIVRQIVFDLYLAKRSAALVCDRVLRPAMYEIGECWACGEAEIYQERRSCEILLRVLHEMRRLLPPVNPHRMCLGGTAPKDFYVLPNAMVELVLRDCGYQSMSLGSGLPMTTLEAALRDQRPEIFWLSVSYLPDENAFLAEFQQLSRTAKQYNTRLIVGGQVLDDEIRSRMEHCDFCADLESLAKLVGNVHED